MSCAERYSLRLSEDNMRHQQWILYKFAKCSCAKLDFFQFHSLFFFSNLAQKGCMKQNKSILCYQDRMISTCFDWFRLLKPPCWLHFWMYFFGTERGLWILYTSLTLEETLGEHLFNGQCEQREWGTAKFSIYTRVRISVVNVNVLVLTSEIIQNVHKGLTMIRLFIYFTLS